MLAARRELYGLLGQAQLADATLAPFGNPWPVTLPTDGRCYMSLARDMPQIGATVVRASVRATVGLFDETLMSDQDWDWHLRLAARHQIGFVQVPCVLLRQRPPATTDDLYWKRLATMRRIFWHNVRRAGKRRPPAPFIAQAYARHSGMFA
jgi:hypothetical protein